MSGELLLGLDLGTTRVGALLVDATGQRLAFAERPLTTRFPEPGRVEQDAEEMLARSVEVLREALASAGVQATDVAGLGITTQRATVIAWAEGRALSPAIGWQDQRGAPRVEELRARGIPYNTQASATKMQWLLRENAAVADAERAGSLRLANPDAWLTERLTEGAPFVTDPGCAAATGLYSLAEGAFSAGACGLFDLDPRHLPEVVETTAVVGETAAEWLGAPVPVAARAGDQQAAAFAQGTHRPGDAKLTLGTSAMLDVHHDGMPVDPPVGTYPLALWRLPAPAGDAFCVEGSVHTAGAALDWLCEIGVLPSPEDADRIAAEVESSGGVMLVPAFQGLGTPYMDDDARGLLCGITRGSRRGHLVRAALEGIAHRCTDLLEALEVDVDVLPVDGGLAASDRLLQDLADLSGTPVERAAELETTALGAALLAGLATKRLPDLEACRAARAPGRRFEPTRPSNERQLLRKDWQRAIDRAR
ncbi:MAG: FGGY family carbohydrate kinase [Myxococcota bacterium]|nr:FGGY family carbohydrate kinase [Myxococcota bacterium]